MKKLLFSILIMFMFIVSVNAVTKDEINTWGKKMADSGNYAAFCVYSFESNCSSWTSSGCKRYVYAIGLPKDTKSKPEYFPIEKVGFTGKFFKDGKAKGLSDKPVGTTNYSSCMPALTSRTAFQSTSGYTCPSFTWEDTWIDELDTGTSTYTTCEGNTGEFILVNGLSNAKRKVDPNASVNVIYKYGSESDKIDASNQITCTYGTDNKTSIILRYDRDANTVQYSLANAYDSVRFNPANIGKNEKNQKEYFVSSSGSLKCPYVECITETGVGATGEAADVTLVARLHNSATPAVSSSSNLCKLNSKGASDSEQEEVSHEEYTGGFPGIGFGEAQTCEEFIGSSTRSLLKLFKVIIQVAAVVLTIVMGMVAFIPPITNNDKDGLNKALKKFVKLLIIMAAILLLPTLVRLIGMLAGFDLSCI